MGTRYERRTEKRTNANKDKRMAWCGTVRKLFRKLPILFYSNSNVVLRAQKLSNQRSLLFSSSFVPFCWNPERIRASLSFARFSLPLLSTKDIFFNLEIPILHVLVHLAHDAELCFLFSPPFPSFFFFHLSLSSCKIESLSMDIHR